MNRFDAKKILIRRMGAFITTIALLTFIVLLLYNYFISKKIILDNIKDNTRTLAVSTLSQINTVLVSAEKMPENIAYVLECVDLNMNEIRKIFRTLVEKNDCIYGSAIAYEPYMFNDSTKLFCPYFYRADKGSVSYKNLATPEYDYLNKDWYKVAKNGKYGIWSEPYFDSDGGDIMMVTFSQPFYKYVNGEKKFAGVITCDISLKWLEDLISKIKIFDTGYAFILSPRGIFIAHPNKEYYQQKKSFFSLSDQYNDKKEMELGKKMLKGETGYERYYSHNRGKNCYLYFQPLAATGCTLGIVIPEDELLFKLKALTFTLFLIGAIGNLPSILIKVAARGIIAPLKASYEKYKEIYSKIISSIKKK